MVTFLVEAALLIVTSARSHVPAIENAAQLFSWLIAWPKRLRGKIPALSGGASLRHHSKNCSTNGRTC
jgi:hypothetical protein